MSPLLRAYLAFSALSDPIWRLAHRRRLKKGKEVAERLPEKYGTYTRSRPDGTLLWFHALSVGESLALVPLIERALADLPDAHVILTTSTATSVLALSRAALPERCTHLQLPIDTRRATRQFLDHWRPDIAIFSELDFWPRLMVETHNRKIPLVLVNSRMPEKNMANRARMGSALREMLALFDVMLVQEPKSRERFIALGADPEKIRIVGALKSAARPLPAKVDALAELRMAIGDRPVWLAAAIWVGEAKMVSSAHKLVTQDRPEALLIVAPRNTHDGDAAELALRRDFSRIARRSRDEGLRGDTQVYLADTIGEMGFWYRLAQVSFVGHSLDLDGEGLEGKNPFEAAALESAILHGPSVSYFSESYRSLNDSGGSRQVEDVAMLASAVVESFEEKNRTLMVKGALRVIDAQKDILEETWRHVCETLDARKH